MSLNSRAGHSEPPAGPVRDLTVFFPFHDEQENIERVARSAVDVLDRLGVDWEVLLVDDGSTDRTGAIADALAAGDRRIRALHHPVNRGYGAALRTGFAHATKAWVFYTDGDGQFDLADLPKVLAVAAGCDIVSAYRADRREGATRKLMAWCWGRAVRAVLGLRVRDVDCAFKLYRRELFDHIELRSEGALIDAEILARAVRAGYTVAQAPVPHYPRRSGRPSGGNLRVALRAVRELLRLRKSILATPKVK